MHQYFPNEKHVLNNSISAIFKAEQNKLNMFECRILKQPIFGHERLIYQNKMYKPINQKVSKD